MKKKIITGILLIFGFAQIIAQVDIGKETLKNDHSSTKEERSNELKLLKNNGKAGDTAQRPLLTEYLTNAKNLPNWVFIASHRAQYNGGTQPENSMEAIQELGLSIGQSKAEIVELDIKISSDGVVYVMHDDYLQRTTDFLDKFPGIGRGGTDIYGHYDHYTWEQVQSLTLRKADFSYTSAKVPLFRDVLRYIKYETGALINLDIGDINVFRAVWDIVDKENAFQVCIFKTSQISALDYAGQYYYALPEEKRGKVIFFPMITMNNPGHPGDPMGAYNEWENSCILLPFQCLAKGYELGYRGNPTEDALLDVVKAVRTKNRVRVHVFNTYPDTYEGRYRGNVNIGQCCNDAYDARGDWGYLLDPRGLGNYTQGVNGYIITDDPKTLCRYLTRLGMRTASEADCK